MTGSRTTPASPAADTRSQSYDVIVIGGGQAGLAIGLAGHGLKDLWQHRTQFVANTRWWPPFCLVVDFTVAAILAVEIIAGLHFHH